MTITRALTVSMAAAAEERARHRLVQMHPKDYRLLLAEELETARLVLEEHRKESAA